jgi:hypothetical protein
MVVAGPTGRAGADAGQRRCPVTPRAGQPKLPQWQPLALGWRWRRWGYGWQPQGRGRPAGAQP